MAQPNDATTQTKDEGPRNQHLFSVDDRQPAGVKTGSKANGDANENDNSACFPKAEPLLETFRWLKPSEVDPLLRVTDPPEQMRQWTTHGPKDPLYEITDPPEQIRRWTTHGPKDPLYEITDPPEQIRRWTTHGPKDPLFQITDPPEQMRRWATHEPKDPLLQIKDPPARRWFTLDPTEPAERVKVKDPSWEPGVVHSTGPASPLHSFRDPPGQMRRLFKEPDPLLQIKDPPYRGTPGDPARLFRDPPGEYTFRLTPELRRQLLLLAPEKPVVCD